MTNNKEIEKMDFESYHILTICSIILGLSLALLTYVTNNEPNLIAIKVIFWLIIIPFGLEAIAVLLFNILNWGKKILDIGLLLCFISLLVSLIILFYDKVMPKISITNNIYWMAPAWVGLLFVITTGLTIWAATQDIKIKNSIYNKYYKISKLLEEEEVYITRIVVITDWISLVHRVGEICGIRYNNSPIFGSRIYGISFTPYKLSTFFEEDIKLTKEKILLITDAKNLHEIINVFEKNSNNKIVGVMVNYKLNKNIKYKLKNYIIEELNI
ncbi:MAG: hypothetical protein ABIJ18_05930 [archaeon]